MFGDFWENFGLQFPFFGADAQGGMFAALQSPEPNAQPHQGMQPTHSPSPPDAQAVAAPQPKPSPGGSPLASPMAPQVAGAPQQRGSFQLSQNYPPDDSRHGGMWDNPEEAAHLREMNIRNDYPSLYWRSKSKQPKQNQQPDETG